MSVVMVILTILLAAALVLSAYIKLTRREPYVQGYLRVGVPVSRLNQLAAILLAGAAGLLLGLLWPPLGVAAAAGVTAYFLVAIGFHIRARDMRNLVNPATLAALAAVTLSLRLVTL